MLARRVVACLDVSGGRVVKGTQFVNLVDAGDPVMLAMEYERQGADEIVFLDISATPDARGMLAGVVRETAERLFVPLTVGGGIRSADDVGNALRCGADKVCINSAAVRRPELLTEAAMRFGSQCIVASIDARQTRPGGWEVFIAGGAAATGMDAIEWAVRCAALGAGEILITSIDRDGTRSGYDVDLTRAVCEAVAVPVVASGGAGSVPDIREVLTTTGAAAALVAGTLHDATTTVQAIKLELADAGIQVRQGT
jgi:cyclase